MATHLPLLSYHVDTSNWIFQEAQDVGFTKMYGRNCHPEWYQYPNFTGLAHGLIGVARGATGRIKKFGVHLQSPDRAIVQFLREFWLGGGDLEGGSG